MAGPFETILNVFRSKDNIKKRADEALAEGPRKNSKRPIKKWRPKPRLMQKLRPHCKTSVKTFSPMNNACGKNPAIRN